MKKIKTNNKINNEITIEKTESFVCSEEDLVLKRLDIVIFYKFPEYSRSYFRNLIDQGLITINKSKTAKASYKIKENDLIEIKFPKVIQYDLTPTEVEFGIVDIQPEFLIINKPAGLLVHPSEFSKAEVTLVHGLMYKFEELKELNNSERPGIVHRIDRGTSGLMIIARNTKSQIRLSNMFKDRVIKKTYLAIVKGHPPKNGKIELPIGRHPNQRHLMSHQSHNPKKALTYYKVLQYFKNESLVEIKIVTGRTHQIRVHMAAIGHGIIGDDYYGYQSKTINRPALHAHELAFEFKDKPYSYKQEVPEDFQKLIDSLKERNN